MKVLRQICAITVLTLVFTQVAVAEEGVIHPGIIPPPPPPPPTVSEPTPPGVAQPGEVFINEDGTIDLVTEMTLTLFQNLIALF